MFAGLILYVIIYIIGNLSETMSFFTAILSPGAWIFVGVGGLTAETKYAIQFVISVFFWSVFGAVLGWVYGKIKNINQVR